MYAIIYSKVDLDIEAKRKVGYRYLESRDASSIS
jgi:hypothetical protein